MEAVIALCALIYAAIEVRQFKAQRQLGHDEARATAAVDVWDTVSFGVDSIESLHNIPIVPRGHDHDYVAAQLEVWGKRTVEAVAGLNRSIGRSVLLLGDTQIHDDLLALSDMLNSLTERNQTMRYPPDGGPFRYPERPFSLATIEERDTALATKNRILRKLNAVALRQAAVPPH